MHFIKDAAPSYVLQRQTNSLHRRALMHLIFAENIYVSIAGFTTPTEPHPKPKGGRESQVASRMKDVQKHMEINLGGYTSDCVQDINFGCRNLSHTYKDLIYSRCRHAAEKPQQYKHIYARTHSNVEHI